MTIVNTLRVLALTLVFTQSIGAVMAATGPYTIDILIAPYHPGFVDSWLFDINEPGQSTGYVTQNLSSGPARTAVTYHQGDLQPLPIRSSLDINNLGDIIGNDINFQPHFVAAGGPAMPIEVADNYVSLFFQGGLNDSANVLIQNFPFDPANMPPNAFSGLSFWKAGTTEALSVLDSLYPYVNPPDPQDFLSGPSSSSFTVSPTRLNNANQFAAGIQHSTFDPVDPLNDEDDQFTDLFVQAYIYDGQGAYSLLETVTIGDEIRPIDIDESGIVFGWSGGDLALWESNGALLSVLPLPTESLREFGDFGSSSVQRNELGQIVGVTVDGGVVFYDPLTDAWTDITSTIAGLGTGTFSSIQGFNGRGQFVGLVRPPAGGGVFGYVVTPVPEPGSLVICGIGLVVAAYVRCRKISKIHHAVVQPQIFVAEDNAMLKRLSTGLMTLAIFMGAIKESQAGPIDVSYTVSGTPGNYDLDFSVTNNMLAWPTQNVYFFAVRLSVDNIVGSPAPFFNNAPADANWFNYGGSATDYNNTWIASGPPFAPPFCYRVLRIRGSS